MTTTTFLTNNEYGIYKGYTNFATFLAAEGYPTEAALDQFREDVYGWMVGYIGTDNARSTYDTWIEYRAVELLISGEIAKNKIENYIASSIMELFGENDKAEQDAIEEVGNRGVVEG
jgi:hypothetical protein